jgi:GT2 family glycosyltransferase
MYTISVVIVTHNRSHILVSCLDHLHQQTLKPKEILVIDNGSTDDTQSLVSSRFPHVRLIRSEQNLGIPAGRNLGYRLAEGDICVTLDDDAQFEIPEALAKLPDYFAQDPALCCVSFRVKDLQGTTVRRFIPRRDRRIMPDDCQGASFVGTGHAMHRARFLALGGFWERLGLYFGEEPDLSYRILEANYHILHSHSISVLHGETPHARPPARRLYHGTRNTPWIALKNLPYYSVASLTILAWGYYGLQALRYGQIRPYIRGIVDCLKGIKPVLAERRCIRSSTIEKLKRLSGVHWY